MTRITPFTIERFTYGDCHYLARALSILGDLRIGALLEGNSGPTLHAFALLEDDRALDVNGVHEIDDLVAAWYTIYGADGWCETSWDELRALGWETPAYGRWTYTRARQVARYLLDKHALA